MPLTGVAFPYVKINLQHFENNSFHASKNLLYLRHQTNQQRGNTMIFEKHEEPFTENEAFAIELFMSKIAGRSWVSARVENNTLIIECTPGHQHTAYEIFKKDNGTWEIDYHRGHYVIRKIMWYMYGAGDFMEMLRFLVEQKDVTLN